MTHPASSLPPSSSAQALRARLQSDREFTRGLTDAILVAADLRGTVTLNEVPESPDGFLVFRASVLGAKVGADRRGRPLHLVTVTMAYDGRYTLSDLVRTKAPSSPPDSRARSNISPAPGTGDTAASLRKALRTNRAFQDEVKAGALVALGLPVNAKTLSMANFHGGNEVYPGRIEVRVDVRGPNGVRRVVVPVTFALEILPGTVS